MFITADLTRTRSELLSSGVTDRPGCYVVRHSGKCLYIGRSGRILTRVMAHWIDQDDGNGTQWRLAGNSEWYFEKPFAPRGCRISVVYCHVVVTGSMEANLIRDLRPQFNSHRNLKLCTENILPPCTQDQWLVPASAPTR